MALCRRKRVCRDNVGVFSLRVYMCESVYCMLHLKTAVTRIYIFMLGLLRLLYCFLSIRMRDFILTPLFLHDGTVGLQGLTMKQ